MVLLFLSHQAHLRELVSPIVWVVREEGVLVVVGRSDDLQFHAQGVAKQGQLSLQAERQC